jgi:ribokinase
VVVGSANVDILAAVDTIPKEGERVTANAFTTQAGGMAANCACAAAAVGGEVVFFGRTGQDALSEVLLADFARYGVDTQGLRRDAEHTTVNLITTPASGERTIITEQNVHHPAALAGYLEHTSPALLYVDGYHLGMIDAEILTAKAAGTRCFVDVDGAVNTYQRDLIIQRLANFDFILWNPQVSRALFAEYSPAEASRILAKDARAVILTQAAGDVLVFQGDNVQAFAVPDQPKVVDTTGAGDTFAGVFLHALTTFASLEQAVTKAIDAATQSVAYVGARGALGALEPF